MSEELNDFIEENSDSLQALLPGYDIATLASQQNSNELRTYLLSGREGMRVIDKIICHINKESVVSVSWAVYEDPLNAILTQKNMNMMQAWFDKFPDSIGNSLLYGSVYKNNDLAMFLIEKGANINVVGEEGLTPLLLTIIDGNHKFFKELLKRKVNLNENGFRVSALVLALENKRWEMADLLIREGAHIEVDSDFIKKHLITIIKDG